MSDVNRASALLSDVPRPLFHPAISPIWFRTSKVIAIEDQYLRRCTNLFYYIFMIVVHLPRILVSLGEFLADVQHINEKSNSSYSHLFLLQ